MSTIRAENVQLRLRRDPFSRHAVGIGNLMSYMQFFVKHPMAEAVFSCNKIVLDICQRCRILKDILSRRHVRQLEAVYLPAFQCSEQQSNTLSYIRVLLPHGLSKCYKTLLSRNTRYCSPISGRLLK